jgi:rfaE bifunctional protein nucleotidyltransferase chain/domain
VKRYAQQRKILNRLIRAKVARRGELAALPIVVDPVRGVQLLRVGITQGRRGGRFQHQDVSQARRQGHCLIVAVNSDASARRLKGPNRPIIGQEERAEMLGALDCVDYVTIFDEDTPQPLLRMLQPDVLVKGGATPVIVGREIVEAYGGKVLNLELVAGLSTTAIIDRIMGKNGQ